MDEHCSGRGLKVYLLPIELWFARETQGGQDQQNLQGTDEQQQAQCMLKDADWYPLTIGLNQWKDQASTAGGQAIQNLVITGSLITIIPLVIAFLLLQKYWQSGLAAGAVKE